MKQVKEGGNTLSLKQIAVIMSHHVSELYLWLLVASVQTYWPGKQLDALQTMSFLSDIHKPILCLWPPLSTLCTRGFTMRPAFGGSTGRCSDVDVVTVCCGDESSAKRWSCRFMFTLSPVAMSCGYRRKEWDCEYERQRWASSDGCLGSPSWIGWGGIHTETRPGLRLFLLWISLPGFCASAAALHAQ